MNGDVLEMVQDWHKGIGQYQKDPCKKSDAGSIPVISKSI